MREKILLKSIAFLFIWLLSACANLPPDKPICVELSLEEGSCVNIVSGKQFIVDEKNTYEGKTWWELRNEMLALPVSTWVEIKKFIIKSCKKYEGSCQKGIESWDRTLNYIDTQIEIKTGDKP